MASANITALTNYGPNSQPADLLYMGKSPFGATDDRKITCDDFLALITRNITDKSLSFGGGSVATVSAANQGKLRYNETSQKFEYSENVGSYRQWLTPAGVTGSVQVNNGAFLLDGDAKFIYDTASSTVIIGSSAGVGSLNIVTGV